MDGHMVAGGACPLTDPAMWAARMLDAPRRHGRGDGLDHRVLRRRHDEYRAGGCQSLFLVRQREQAVVTDALEPGRQGMLQKTVDKLARLDNQLAGFPTWELQSVWKITD